MRRLAARVPTYVTLKEVKKRWGQQLKDQAQLDGWQRDGSAAAIAALCDFE